MPASGPGLPPPDPRTSGPPTEGTLLDAFRTRLATIPGGPPRRPQAFPVANLSVLGLLQRVAEGRGRRSVPGPAPRPGDAVRAPVEAGPLWQATRAVGVGTGVLLCWQVLASLHLASPSLPWVVPVMAVAAVMALARRATTRELDSL